MAHIATDASPTVRSWGQGVGAGTLALWCRVLGRDAAQAWSDRLADEGCATGTLSPMGFIDPRSDSPAPGQHVPVPACTAGSGSAGAGSGQAYAGGGPGVATGRERFGLAEDVYATPVAAWKWVRLRADGDRLMFAPLHKHGGRAVVYGSDAWARCLLGGTHQAPEAGCRCGFYGVRRRDDLSRFAEPDPGLGLARVEFAGTVIEHDFGFRASWQRVLQVTVADRCHRCGSPAVLLSQMRRGCCDVGPVCLRHVRGRTWAFGDAAVLGCDVQVGALQVPWHALKVRVLLGGAMPPLLAVLVGVLIGVRTGSAMPVTLSGMPGAGWLGVADGAWNRSCSRVADRIGDAGVARLRAKVRAWALVAALGAFAVAGVVGVAAGS